MTRAVFDRSMEQWYPAEEELAPENICPTCNQYKDTTNAFCNECVNAMVSTLESVIEYETKWADADTQSILELMQIGMERLIDNYESRE